MNISESLLPDNDERVIVVEYDPVSLRVLWIDISVVTVILQRYFEHISAKSKRAEIDKLLTTVEWIELHKDKKNGRRVLAESVVIEHQHELVTAKALTQADYDVLFVPKGMFKRTDKKFDVFLIRDHVLLKADLKSITSKNPATIAVRIKDGCEQASRIVIDISSDIAYRELIDGLRSGVTNNHLIKEVLLLYRNKFYRLSKDVIISKRIYQILQ